MSIGLRFEPMDPPRVPRMPEMDLINVIFFFWDLKIMVKIELTSRILDEQVPLVRWADLNHFLD